MRYLDLFSGIGGFTLGIQQAYENYNLVRTTSTPDTEDRRNKPLPNISDGNMRRTNTCIGYSEIDKYAIQVYNKHFNHKNYGDICSIDWEEVPDIDLLVGGFPCQSFSIAGKRKGFEDTRGTLFFEIAKGLKTKQPNLVLLENVKGLISHDKGKTLETILETLQELGYYVNIEVYNSKDFGVPQNRERIFILCRHIKTLISDGQEQKLNLSSPIIKEFLFQTLLNNLTEVQKLQEAKSKDWVMGYLLWKEISQNQNLSEENIKAGILIPTEESKSLSTEEVWQNIDIWLRKNLEENSSELNKSTILTAIKQTIESKTFTFQKMQRNILLLIVQSRNLSKDSWKKTLSDLILIKEHTKKYARINNQKEEIIITESGNAYISSNLQDTEKHFIVGHLRNSPRPKVFPIGESSGGDIKSQGKTQGKGQRVRSKNTLAGSLRVGGGDTKDLIASTLAQRDYKGGNNLIQLNQPTHSNNRIYSEKGLSPTLNTMQGGNRQPFIESNNKKYGKLDDRTLESKERLQGQKGDLFGVQGGEENGDTPHRQGLAQQQTGESSRNMQKLPHKDTQGEEDVQDLRKATKVSGVLRETLSEVQEVGKSNESEKQSILRGSRIRRLTPLETERLQGFPDKFTELGIDNNYHIRYNKSSNNKLDICKQSTIKKLNSKNAQWKVVKENKLPISVTASCTIKDGNEQEKQILLKGLLKEIKSVNIVITKLEKSGQWECVINIIKCGDYTEMPSMWKIKEVDQAVEDTLEILQENQSTELLWKSISEENSNQVKYLTILMELRPIIESVIYTFAQGLSMQLSINNLNVLSQNLLTARILSLRTESTVKISDSSRYKCLGNAVTVNVIQAIMEKLI